MKPMKKKMESKGKPKVPNPEEIQNLPAFEQVYAWVRCIPRGRVMTYGQISRLIDERLSAQGVGWAMKACPSDDIPWYRVVNGKGGVSTNKISVYNGDRQRALLEGEGVIFREDGTMDLGSYQWDPR
jgi:methylated-DNA-protein-cysteine methyltransferase-like protein